MKKIGNIYIDDEILERFLNLANQGYLSECYELLMQIIDGTVKSLKIGVFTLISENWNLKELKESLK